MKANADVNARGLDDLTPLHDAAVNAHCKVSILSSVATLPQVKRRFLTMLCLDFKFYILDYS